MMLFVDFLALLCWFGTVYAFTVPICHLVLDEEREDKKVALRVLGLLVVVWFTIKFLEKGVLDRIMQYNTVPSVGRWSCINSSNVLTNIEFHDPYPSFPSGHMLLGTGTGLFLLRYYNSLNTKILVCICIGTSAFIKMYMNMHSIWDIAFTILIAVSICCILRKCYSHTKNVSVVDMEQDKILGYPLKRTELSDGWETILKSILAIILSCIFLYMFFKLCNVILPLI